jgi:hypothetical protein
MSNIINFPGFFLLDDRNTILKSGKVYKNTKAMVADLTPQELRRTHEWQGERVGYSDYRARVMCAALYGGVPQRRDGQHDRHAAQSRGGTGRDLRPRSWPACRGRGTVRADLGSM